MNDGSTARVIHPGPGVDGCLQSGRVLGRSDLGGTRGMVPPLARCTGFSRLGGGRDRAGTPPAARPPRGSPLGPVRRDRLRLEWAGHRGAPAGASAVLACGRGGVCRRRHPRPVPTMDL